MSNNDFDLDLQVNSSSTEEVTPDTWTTIIRVTVRFCTNVTRNATCTTGTLTVLTKCAD